MIHLHWISAVAIVLASASLSVMAQDKPHQASLPDPSDPNAAVPAAIYDSVLRHYRRTEDTAPPEKVWRKANEEVQGGGHAGHSGHGAHGNTMPRPETAPPATAPADHHTHHHGKKK